MLDIDADLSTASHGEQRKFMGVGEVKLDLVGGFAGELWLAMRT